MVKVTAIGLVVPAHAVDDHFVAALVHALADPLIEAGLSLVTSVIESPEAEEKLYRHWARSGGVAGVALLGVKHLDPRIALLQSLGLPFAGVVSAKNAGTFPAVVVDAAVSVTALRSFFARRNYKRVVYFADPTQSVTSSARASAVGGHFEISSKAFGEDAVISAALDADADGPVVLLFDSDVEAAAALAALAQRAIRVPEDVAVVSWTESTLCQSTLPSITAVNRRGREIGALLGERMLATIAGEPTVTVAAPEPFIVMRESA